VWVISAGGRSGPTSAQERAAAGDLVAPNPTPSRPSCYCAATGWCHAAWIGTLSPAQGVRRAAQLCWVATKPGRKAVGAVVVVAADGFLRTSARSGRCCGVSLH